LSRAIELVDATDYTIFVISLYSNIRFF